LATRQRIAESIRLKTLESANWQEGAQASDGPGNDMSGMRRVTGVEAEEEDLEEQNVRREATNAPAEPRTVERSSLRIKASKSASEGLAICASG